MMLRVTDAATAAETTPIEMATDGRKEVTVAVSEAVRSMRPDASTVPAPVIAARVTVEYRFVDDAPAAAMPTVLPEIPTASV